MSDENITAPTMSDYQLNPHLLVLKRVKYSRSCLKQDKVKYDHGKVVNIYEINFSWDK